MGAAPKALRIVLVTQYFPPEIGATQTRMQAFAEYLSARGHQVTVVTEFPNHPVGVIPDGTAAATSLTTGRTPTASSVSGCAQAPRRPRRTRMAFYLSYMGLASASAPLRPVDVVVATTPPLFAGLAGLASPG